jgi:uncharacterized protein
MFRKKIIRRILWLALSLVILANCMAFFHAWRFTHFSGDQPKTNPNQLSFAGKLKTLFFGADNPRPQNSNLPARQYTLIKLQSNKTIECWNMAADSARGTVIIFHGYGGMKSSMLDKAEVFLSLGYNTMVVDFMGSGGSEGNQTTIGYKEAEEVKTCFEYLQKSGEKNIYLFGTSMGAVAILKAIDDYGFNPAGIIIECPFGSLYKTTVARFNAMGVPAVPMAGLLVFWGGIQNGFWGFSHNPVDYARSVKCPTLLLYGEKDKRVSRSEIEAIYKNLAGEKRLKTYPLAGHENYLIQYGIEWKRDIDSFLRP